MNIKDIIKNNEVYFYYYRHNVLYYKIYVDSVEYYFPVPLEDVGDASLYEREKAITYMRYIRKALEDGTFVKTSK